MPRAAKSIIKARSGPLDSRGANASGRGSPSNANTSGRAKVTSARPDLNPRAIPISEKEPNYIIMVNLVVTSDPMITRTLSVPPSLSLASLHTVIQVAFGWTDSHMHSFSVKLDSSDSETPRTLMHLENYNEDEGEGSEDGLSSLGETGDEEEWTLKEIFEKKEWEVDSHHPSLEPQGPRRVNVGIGEVDIMYEYDMGDSWEHHITLLGRATQCLHKVVGSGKIDAVICLGGEGHPCAEECGAEPGWEDLKEAFRKPRGDPELKKWYKEICVNGDKKGLNPYKWNLHEVNEVLCKMKF